MPRVPLSQGPQGIVQAQNGGYMQQVDGGLPARQLASAVGQVGEAVDRLAERDAQDQAWRAQADINTAWVKWNAKESEASRGVNAKGYTERVQQWWKDAADIYGKDLNPMSKRLVGRSLMQAQVSALDGASRHENQELDRARAEALDGSLQAEVSRGAAGGPAAAVGAVDAIQTNVREFAAATGKPTKWVDAKELHYTTALHANVIAGLMQVDPAKAQEYFTANKGQIDGTRHDDIIKGLKTASLAAVAQDKGAELAAKYDFTKTGDALKEIDKLDMTPEQKSAVRAEVEHRHAVAQSDADKSNALMVGKVHEMIYSGMTKAQIMRSPEYQALRDKGAMLQAIDNKAYTDVLRANANDARALQALQRKQAEIHIAQASTAFAYADPVVLANTPREKIAAQLPTLGMQWTQDLLNRKDALEKKDVNLDDAKLDAQDIKTVATEFFGIDAANLKNPHDKAAFITFQSRAERLIADTQRELKRPMTREEKVKLIQGEATRTVKTGGFLGFFQTDAPVMTLDAKKLSDVEIPAEANKQIVDWLAAKRKQDPKNPKYADTPENRAKNYLRLISPAANFIEPPAPQ